MCQSNDIGINSNNLQQISHVLLFCTILRQWQDKNHAFKRTSKDFCCMLKVTTLLKGALIARVNGECKQICHELVVKNTVVHPGRMLSKERHSSENDDTSRCAVQQFSSSDLFSRNAVICVQFVRNLFGKNVKAVELDTQMDSNHPTREKCI